MAKGIFGGFKGMDAFGKTMDDIKVKTRTGALLTMISAAIICTFTLMEFVDYRSVHRDTSMIVDRSRGEKLTIRMNITFPHVPCYLLSLDVMDISGEHQTDLTHDIVKSRLDTDGKQIWTGNVNGGPSLPPLLRRTQETVANQFRVSSSPLYHSPSETQTQIELELSSSSSSAGTDSPPPPPVPTWSKPPGHGFHDRTHRNEFLENRNMVNNPFANNPIRRGKFGGPMAPAQFSPPSPYTPSSHSSSSSASPSSLVAHSESASAPHSESSPHATTTHVKLHGHGHHDRTHRNSWLDHMAMVADPFLNTNDNHNAVPPPPLRPAHDGPPPSLRPGYVASETQTQTHTPVPPAHSSDALPEHAPESHSDISPQPTAAPDHQLPPDPQHQRHMQPPSQRPDIKIPGHGIPNMYHRDDFPNRNWLVDNPFGNAPVRNDEPYSFVGFAMDHASETDSASASDSESTPVYTNLPTPARGGGKFYTNLPPGYSNTPVYSNGGKYFVPDPAPTDAESPDSTNTMNTNDDTNTNTDNNNNMYTSTTEPEFHDVYTNLPPGYSSDVPTYTNGGQFFIPEPTQTETHTTETYTTDDNDVYTNLPPGYSPTYTNGGQFFIPEPTNDVYTNLPPNYSHHSESASSDPTNTNTFTPPWPSKPPGHGFHDRTHRNEFLENRNMVNDPFANNPIRRGRVNVGSPAPSTPPHTPSSPPEPSPSAFQNNVAPPPNAYSQPVPVHGQPAPSEYDIKFPELKNDIDKVASARGPNYCGSCYGGEPAGDWGGCCNSCEQVRQAYLNKGWAFADPDAIEQCVAEHWKDKIQEQSHEGCNIAGRVKINKVIGSIHLSPGKSFQMNGMYAHDLVPYLRDGNHHDWGHYIHQFAFESPIEEYKFHLSESMRRKLGIVINPLDFHRARTESAEYMFQYFLKVVGVRYHFLDKDFVQSYQYSVTHYERDLARSGAEHDKQGTTITHTTTGQPGAFFNFEISPMMVIHEETRQSFAHFVTSTCAIIGGVLTIASIVDSVLFSATRAMKSNGAAANGNGYKHH